MKNGLENEPCYLLRKTKNHPLINNAKLRVFIVFKDERMISESFYLAEDTRRTHIPIIRNWLWAFLSKSSENSN